MWYQTSADKSLKIRRRTLVLCLPEYRTSKQDVMETERNTPPARTQHIENLRLLKLVSGRLKFHEWEQDHLHACEVCQGVLYVLVNKQIGATTGMDGRPPGEAA
jgi:hypothetical protein